MELRVATIPEHQAQIDYLEQLSLAMKKLYWNLFDLPIVRDLSQDMLEEWSSTHRAKLVGCAGVKDGQVIPDLHESELMTIDRVVRCLLEALAANAALRDMITLDDIHRIEQITPTLFTCRSITFN